MDESKPAGPLRRGWTTGACATAAAKAAYIGWQKGDCPDPIEIVASGGTSMIGGFIDIFQDEFESINFPIEVKNIRRAEDPLFSVAKGCLVAALSDL